MNRRRASSIAVNSARRGAVMVFALMALFVASTIVATLLQITSLAHRQFKREENRVQARLLADAGIARAVEKLRQQSDFEQETWTVSTDQLSQQGAATVRLNVATDKNLPKQKTITAIAEFPAGRPDAIKVTQQFTISLAR